MVLNVLDSILHMSGLVILSIEKHNFLGNVRFEKDVFNGNSYPAVHCGNTYSEEIERKVAILMTRPYCETPLRGQMDEKET